MSAATLTTFVIILSIAHLPQETAGVPLLLLPQPGVRLFKGWATVSGVTPGVNSGQSGTSTVNSPTLGGTLLGAGSDVSSVGSGTAGGLNGGSVQVAAKNGPKHGGLGTVSFSFLVPFLLSHELYFLSSTDFEFTGSNPLLFPLPSLFLQS